MKKSFWRKTVVSTIMVASLSLTNVGAILASEWNNEVTSEWGMQSLRNSALFAAEDQKKESYSFEDFVERLYTVALNRPSEAAGKKYWVDEIKNGKRTGAECAHFFLIEAEEFKNRKLSTEDFVETLYSTFFGRKSEPNGKAYWVSELRKGTKNRDDVINGFIDSTEWCNICATYGVKSGSPTAKAEIPSEGAKAFATRLYKNALGREPDNDGLKYWSLALTNLEQTGTDAARLFFESDEFRYLRTSNSEYVSRLYLTFMDRYGETDGVNYWVNELTNGKTRKEVLAGFTNSQEFKDICASCGIEVGSYSTSVSKRVGVSLSKEKVYGAYYDYLMNNYSRVLSVDCMNYDAGAHSCSLYDINGDGVEELFLLMDLTKAEAGYFGFYNLYVFTVNEDCEPVLVYENESFDSIGLDVNLTNAIFASKDKKALYFYSDLRDTTTDSSVRGSYCTKINVSNIFNCQTEYTYSYREAWSDIEHAYKEEYDIKEYYKETSSSKKEISLEEYQKLDNEFKNNRSSLIYYPTDLEGFTPNAKSFAQMEEILRPKEFVLPSIGKLEYERKCYYNDLIINPDGTFSGYTFEWAPAGEEQYMDNHIQEFEGRFKNIQKISDYAYSLEVASISKKFTAKDVWEEEAGNKRIGDGHSPFDTAMENGETLILYLAGMPICEDNKIAYNSASLAYGYSMFREYKGPRTPTYMFLDCYHGKLYERVKDFS